MYGCLKSARIFWEHLGSFLYKLGFNQNQYDLCVVNQEIDGSTRTITWHVDDLKISHRSEAVVNDIIEALEKEYSKMTVTTGDRYTYCGMDLVYTNGEVQIGMTVYLKDTLSEFKYEDCRKKVNSQAALHLFNVNPKKLKLDDEKKTLFHKMIAKLLFVSKQGRSDIQVAIAFLTTRLSDPDIDDWKKLARLMRYINSTTNLKFRFSIQDFRAIKWWVDTSYAVHPITCSHTSGTFTLRRGSIYSSSIKQKFIAKSSTEAECIALNNIARQIIWTQNFLQDQGYNTGPSTIHQDNKSTILLAENGIMSSSKWTKYINVHYYFIKDRINR